MINTYNGKITDVFYSNTKWASILVTLSDGSKMVAAGNIINPIKGINITMHGIITSSGKYKNQIKVDYAEYSDGFTSEERAYISFLSSGEIKGIGSKKAVDLVEKFGNNVLDVIENDYEQLATIKGIKKKTAKKIHDNYLNSNSKDYFAIYQITNGEITPNQVKKIIEKYGSNAKNILKKNPYILAKEVDGFGFNKADKLAKSVGINEDSVYRIEAAIVYCLNETANKEGNCYLKLEELFNNFLVLIIPFPFPNMQNKNKIINDLLKNNPIDIDENKKDIIDSWMIKRKHFMDIFLDILKNNSMVVNLENMTDLNNYIKEIEQNNFNFIIEDKERIYLKKMYLTEIKSAKYITELINKKPEKHISINKINTIINDIENENGYKITDEQKNAVINSLNSRISVITGGPGRGKTTIIKIIARSWGKDILILAPTGRAAQRITESTGYPACTIHRYLAKKENNFSEKTLIIIDETSMVDIYLFYNLLNKCNKANFLFVGDVKQLPSIGAGLILKNLVDSPEITTSFLKQGHRNMGSIEINNEKIDKGLSLSEFMFDSNFSYVESDKLNTTDVVINIYLAALKKYNQKDISIITPAVNQRFNVNATTINLKIQEKLHPYNKNDINCSKKFRLGDRVMNIKNIYDQEAIKDGILIKGIFNGECGEIIEINENDEYYKVKFDDNKISNYKFNTEYLSLAYAISVHKSQGSEYPLVIYACNIEHYILLNRMGFYTAESRAKKQIILIGETKAYNMAITNNTILSRNTFLTERISFLKKNNVK